MFIQRKKQGFFSKILFNSKTISLIGFCILALVSLSLSKNLDKHYIINDEIESLKQEIDSTKSKNIGLDKMIDYLESDQFIEEQARLNFGLKKEGENVAVVSFNENKAANPYIELLEEKLMISEEEKANPQNWKNYFFR